MEYLYFYLWNIDLIYDLSAIVSTQMSSLDR